MSVRFIEVLVTERKLSGPCGNHHEVEFQTVSHIGFKHSDWVDQIWEHYETCYSHFCSACVQVVKPTISDCSVSLGYAMDRLEQLPPNQLEMSPAVKEAISSVANKELLDKLLDLN